MKRKWLALVLCLCISLCACAKGEEQASRYIGYTLSGEEGGGSALAEANAYRLSLKESGETTTLTLQFMSGSRMSGTASQTEAANVPPYVLWTLQNPARLMLRLTGLAYWDYERDLPSPGGQVLGSFRYAFEAAEGEEGTETFLCFQLAGDCAYKTEESGGSLVVTLLAKGEPAEEKDKKAEEQEQPWYLIGDAFRDYCAGRLKSRADFTPFYAADLSHILLVSVAYSSKIEAELAKKQLLAQEPLAVAAEWHTAQIPRGQLPAYDENARFAAAYDEPIQRRAGEVQGAEVFLADGLYLGPVPRRLGGGALYAKRIEEGAGVDSYSYAKLYIRDAQGADKALLNYEFATVEQAAFSPDGRKLAVLERSAERTNLYVVDVEMREVTAELTQAGFGELVSAFCWDSMGSVLFAVSGSGEMQVHAYDFSVPDEAKRHTIVDKNGAGEGYIGYCDGEVYFIESEMEKDTIYRIKPEGGVRKAFYSGSAFALSPNNAYMAISAASGGKNAFLLLDMRTGATTAIPADFAVYEFLWSQDSSRVYYFENRLSGGLGEEAGEDTDQAASQTAQDPYPYTLWAYDLESGESLPVCDLAGSSISAAQGPDKLFFVYSDPETAGEKIRATYWIDGNAAALEGRSQPN